MRANFSYGAGFIVLLVLTSAGSADAYALKTLYSFCTQANCADGARPASRPLLDASGNLYLSTTVGGANNFGTVIELIRRKHDVWKEKVLHSFDDRKGALPEGNLIMDVSGNLYGTTVVNNAFELMPGPERRKWKLKVLYRFCSQTNCLDGDSPESGLTYQGAASGALYDGVSPLYGTTANGGAGQELGGVAFALRNDGGQWTEQLLHNFCSNGGLSCTDGDETSGGLVVDPAGNLFGTTRFGGKGADGGTVFKLTPNALRWKEARLHTFCRRTGCPGGGLPQTELWSDPTGTLFGVTTFGGRAPNCAAIGEPNCGVIFELTPDASGYKESVLYTFCSLANCTDGALPFSGVTPDGAGHLLGTTVYGGNGGTIEGATRGSGTVYMQTGGAHQVLYNFCTEADCTDGAVPEGGAVVDAAGHIFGATARGGAYGEGTIFELTP